MTMHDINFQRLDHLMRERYGTLSDGIFQTLTFHNSAEWDGSIIVDVRKWEFPIERSWEYNTADVSSEIAAMKRQLDGD